MRMVAKADRPGARIEIEIEIDRRMMLGLLAGAGGALALPLGAGAVAASPDPAGVKTVKAGVLEVAYLEWGVPDGPPVVLLHGFPYDVHAYDEVGQRLAAKGRRVIVPYLRGYGPTRFLDPATLRVGQQAALGADLLALLDALAIPKATLAGFDWGARAACIVAALHPERVSGLVSSGGAGYNIQNENAFLTPRPAGWERAHWFYYYLNSRRGMAAFSRDPAVFCRYLWKTFSPTWHFKGAVFERSAQSFKNPDFVPVALQSYRFRIGEAAGDLSLEPIERQLSAGPKITVPTIVLQGADEGVDPPEQPDVIAPHFTALRRVTVLPNVGHNAPQEAPEAFATAVHAVDA